MQTVSVIVSLLILLGSAAGWKFYVKAIQENRDHWRDIAKHLKEEVESLNKRSPEYMEQVLQDRIATRESEISRMKDDESQNREKLLIAEWEVERYKRDLDRAQSFGLIANRGYESSGIPLGGSIEKDGIEVSLLGYAAVDSGMLMITDPSYLNLWTELEDGDLDDAWELDVNRESFPYSYKGAVMATRSEHGQLHFPVGHPGVGVAFTTAMGDGEYPVYAERFKGSLIRVFVDVE